MNLDLWAIAYFDKYQFESGPVLLKDITLAFVKAGSRILIQGPQCW